MVPKVKEFIEAAKSKERAEFEKKRDEHLISLGLIKKREKKYSDTFGGGYNLYDEGQNKYYGLFTKPVEVTDEEYEEIKKIATKPEEVENGAENFLRVINGISLVIGIIFAIILIIASVNSYEDESTSFLIAGIAVLLISFVSCAIIRVLLNISNNLHQINAKLK